jgi:hypothetical protein
MTRSPFHVLVGPLCIFFCEEVSISNRLSLIIELEKLKILTSDLLPDIFMLTLPLSPRLSFHFLSGIFE